MTESELKEKERAAVEQYITTSKKAQSNWVKAKNRLYTNANTKPSVFKNANKAVDLVYSLGRLVMLDNRKVVKLAEDDTQFMDSMLNDFYNVAAKYRSVVGV